jgi:ABC-type multidrug transport system fused ATPase/permease subunit
MMAQLFLQDSGFSGLQSLQTGFTRLVEYLPQLIGAIVVLVVGYLLAKLLDKVITKLLQKGRLDERLNANQGGRYAEKISPGGKPSRLVGGVVFWVIMLFVISSAIGTLGIPALTGFMNLVMGYLPNVLAALLIFIVAAAVAGAVGGLAHRMMGDTPTGRIVRAGAPALIMAIALFMILTQLGIAPVIVTVTYIALIGALAVASALAFGLGGREAAADLVNSGYRKAREQNGQVREDLATGRERTRQAAETVQQESRFSQQEGATQRYGQDEHWARPDGDTTGAIRHDDWAAGPLSEDYRPR